MNSRRVMLLANSTWYLANFRAPLIRALVTRGDKVISVAPADATSSSLQSLGCLTHELELNPLGLNPVGDLKLLFDVRRILREFRPDVLLNFTIKPVIYGTIAARSLHIPVINTITGLGTAFIRETWLTQLVEILYGIALHGDNPVIFQNSDDLNLFMQRRLVTSNPCVIVPGAGIDLKAFSAAPLPDGPVCFLLIARLLRDKGLAEFVGAARILKQQHAQLKFQLLGPLGVANRTAIAASELTEWIREGTIQYLGNTDDVRPFIRSAHCIVLPSYREGMSRVLMEAAAMGRPLIASNVAGCREIVKDGWNGLLCKPRDAADLASKMWNFLELSPDARTQMGEHSRAKAEQCFDVNSVVASYTELLEKTISGHVRPLRWTGQKIHLC